MTISEFQKKTLIAVIGVHKAGTTSFYEYISTQEGVFSPLVKELHFFTPLVYNNKATLNIDDYLKHFKKAKEHYILDVSPSYLYGGTAIINKIRSYTDNVKIVVILRDPTERFVSFYKQGLKRGKINIETSLNEYFEQCKLEFNEFIQNKNHKDTFTNRGLREGCYSLYLSDWLREFDNDVHVIFFEDLIKNPELTLDKFGHTLDLNFNWDNVSFDVANQSRRPRFQSISKNKSKFFRKYESFFRKNKKIKQFLKKIYNSVNTTQYSSGDYEVEKEEIVKFYDAYNKDLIKILPQHKNKIEQWR